MGVNKLTGEQILQKLEEIFGNNVYDYAYDDYLEVCPDDFQFSDETQAVAEVEDKAYAEYSGTPYNSQQQKDAWKKWNETPRSAPLKEKEFLDSVGLGEIKEVEQVGGEGEGNTWYTVKYFVDHDVYIKTDGWYSSYEGTEFEDGFGKVVSPKKKMITVYE